MNTCLTHGQSYPQDGYCVYCGPPRTGTSANAYLCQCGQQALGTGQEYCTFCGGRIVPFFRIPTFWIVRPGAPDPPTLTTTTPTYGNAWFFNGSTQ